MDIGARALRAIGTRLERGARTERRDARDDAPTTSLLGAFLRSRMAVAKSPVLTSFFTSFVSSDIAGRSANCEALSRAERCGRASEDARWKGENAMAKACGANERR